MKLRISLENKMRPEQMQKYSEEPIIEITDTMRPLWIHIASGPTLNLMTAILFNTENKTVEARGRARFEFSGDKSVFRTDPKPYSAMVVESLKESGRNTARDMGKIAVLPDVNELSFFHGEEIEAIVQKMNDSNLFDIGKIKNDKKPRDRKPRKSSHKVSKGSKTSKKGI